MIIGLGYKARSGKDTIADYLVQHYGFQKFAFAGALKEACRIIFRLTNRQLHGDMKETKDDFWGITPREILQRVGTECLRHGFADDVWIKALERQVIEWFDSSGDENGPQFRHEHAAITDVRFPNEGDAIIKWGGEMWIVDRPNAAASGGVVGHPSETSMEGYERWMVRLQNDTDLDGLYARVDDLMTVRGIRRIKR